VTSRSAQNTRVSSWCACLTMAIVCSSSTRRPPKRSRVGRWLARRPTSPLTRRRETCWWRVPRACWSTRGTVNSCATFRWRKRWSCRGRLFPYPTGISSRVRCAFHYIRLNNVLGKIKIKHIILLVLSSTHRNACLDKYIRQAIYNSHIIVTLVCLVTCVLATLWHCLLVLVPGGWARKCLFILRFCTLTLRRISMQKLHRITLICLLIDISWNS